MILLTFFKMFSNKDPAFVKFFAFASQVKAYNYINVVLTCSIVIFEANEPQIIFVLIWNIPHLQSNTVQIQTAISRYSGTVVGEVCVFT